MRFSRRTIGKDRFDRQMTPMIDIVFLLLVFFVMTFRVLPLEGDFNLRLPPESSTVMRDESLRPSLTLRLRADEEGNLRDSMLNDQQFANLSELHSHVRSLVGDESGPGSLNDLEIRVESDYRLRYSHAVDALSAVTGYVDEEGNVIRLIDVITFSPP